MSWFYRLRQRLGLAPSDPPKKLDYCLRVLSEPERALRDAVVSTPFEAWRSSANGGGFYIRLSQRSHLNININININISGVWFGVNCMQHTGQTQQYWVRLCQYRENNRLLEKNRVIEDEMAQLKQFTNSNKQPQPPESLDAA